MGFTRIDANVPPRVPDGSATFGTTGGQGFRAGLLKAVSDGLKVAVVGVTGAVGGEFLKLFERRDFPVRELVPLASARSAGKHVEFRGKRSTVAEATERSFVGVDVAFFSAGAGCSRALVPAALHSGAIAIDNSNAFRMREDVPLVVPEINLDAIKPDDKLFPVGNCTAIVLSVAVAPVRLLGEIKRLIVSTYQSASGGGAAVMRELEDQTRDALDGKEVVPKVLPHPYAFNLFSHNAPVGPDGLNEEEAKVSVETRKILGLPQLGMNVTCVRVPVLRAHSVSVTVEFSGPAPTDDAIRGALAVAQGVRVVDDRANNRFPMPSEASGDYDVLVGRIRRDPSNPNAFCMFLSGDQLLKGAALNAVQIAESLIEMGRLAPRPANVESRAANRV